MNSGNEEAKILKLRDLFPGVPEQRLLSGDLEPAEMKVAMASRLAFHLGLGFIPPGAGTSLNLCLANEKEVQPAYRTSLTRTEIFYYVLDCIHHLERSSDHIPYPYSATRFWTGVKRGRYRFTHRDS